MSHYKPHTRDRSVDPHEISVLRQGDDQLSVFVGLREVATRIPICLAEEIADAIMDWCETH